MASAARNKRQYSKRSEVNFRDPAVLADYATRALNGAQKTATEDGRVTPRNSQGDFVRRTFPDLSKSQGYTLMRTLRDLSLLQKKPKLDASGRPTKNYLHYVSLETTKVTSEMILTLRAKGEAPEDQSTSKQTAPSSTDADKAQPEAVDDLADKDFSFKDLIELRQKCGVRLDSLEQQRRDVLGLQSALDKIIDNPRE